MDTALGSGESIGPTRCGRAAVHLLKVDGVVIEKQHGAGTMAPQRVARLGGKREAL